VIGKKKGMSCPLVRRWWELNESGRPRKLIEQQLGGLTTRQDTKVSGDERRRQGESRATPSRIREPGSKKGRKGIDRNSE